MPAINMMVTVERFGTGGATSKLRSGLSRAPADVLIEVLAELRGTVTEFLEHLVQEPIFADKLDEFETTATNGNRLCVEPGHPLLRRLTVLRGRRSSRGYLCADTLLVMDRLPRETRRRLRESHDPIGRVIVDHGLSVERVNLTPIPLSPQDRQSNIADEFIYARQYQIEFGGRPVIDVSEWFLSHLADLLVR
jgi:chorismate-pyruvate lyase